MRYVMLTHDQDIDRRIIQQAKALEGDGWKGTIVCLSHTQEDVHRSEQGLEVFRIGLSKIVPACPVYQAYQRRQKSVLEYCYTRPHALLGGRYRPLARLVNLAFRVASRGNWALYRAHLLAHYHNRRLACPLPFDDCFLEAGRKFPADLVLAHDLPALQAGVVLARNFNAKLAYDAHELYYEQKAFSEVQKDMMRRVEAELIVQADATFTVNESIAREMARRYGCTRPNVLLNVVDPAAGAAESGRKDLLRKRLHLDSGRKILLFQGGLLANRNLERLVAAMKHVTSDAFTLVFMGNGPLKELLQKTASREGIEHRVAFIPAVPAAELIEWTASADVGIIPYPAVDLNTRFCTPNKLFEYIQARLPILANDLPELRRYVRDTGFGRCADMSHPKAIAAAIDGFVADSQALEVARVNLSRRAGEFTWSYAKVAYLETINSLFDKPSAPQTPARSQTLESV